MTEDEDKDDGVEQGYDAVDDLRRRGAVDKTAEDEDDDNDAGVGGHDSEDEDAAIHDR